MKRFLVLIALMGVSALLLAACGGKKSDADAAHTLQLGNTTVNDHGTKDVSKATTVDLEADSYYFEPTFLSGTPGQKLTIKVENDSTTLHNFSAKSLGIDSDVQPKSDSEIEVTFPDSGVVMFFCKYHTGQGMNGELLSGNATPAAPAGAAPVAPSGQSSSDSTY
ncbi:MAG TPA: cupredoxin domain-containing protein [Dehalococcoidia bacterium]|nr:cupredoxin domain-containing protein [Dehalococcoidia bacterium]